MKNKSEENGKNDTYAEDIKTVLSFAETANPVLAKRLHSFLLDNIEITQGLLERFPEKIIDIEIWDEAYVRQIAYQNRDRDFTDRHFPEIMEEAEWYLTNQREYFYREDNEELILRAIDRVDDRYPDESSQKKRKGQSSE